MNSIKISKNNIKLAANIYYPEGFSENEEYKGIVVTHPGGGVKEQVAGSYAQNLAKAGYVAITFDASHQGESEGLPRFLEDPYERISDISSVVDYLTTLEYITEIGALGICAGGGYTLTAIQTDKRIKSAATASAVDIGILFRGEDTNVMNETAKLASDEMTSVAKGNKPNYLYYTPMTKQEADSSPSVLYKEAYDYYRTERAMHKNAPGQLLLSSVNTIFRFNSTSVMKEMTNIPVLLVAGSVAETLAYSKLANETIKDSRLALIDGATHIDLYDKKVDAVTEHLIKFFDETL